jgi:hypothetical protein
MMTTKGYLRPQDFRDWPVWSFSPDSETYSQVRSLEDVPPDMYDFMIHADFTAPNGRIFEGEVVGVNDVFAVGLFAQDESVLINRNSHERSREQVSLLLAALGLEDELSFDTLFPLRFKSKWSRSGIFNDFEGVFEKPD